MTTYPINLKFDEHGIVTHDGLVATAAEAIAKVRADRGDNGLVLGATLQTREIGTRRRTRARFAKDWADEITVGWVRVVPDRDGFRGEALSWRIWESSAEAEEAMASDPELQAILLRNYAAEQRDFRAVLSHFEEFTGRRDSLLTNMPSEFRKPEFRVKLQARLRRECEWLRTLMKAFEGLPPPPALDAFGNEAPIAELRHWMAELIFVATSNSDLDDGPLMNSAKVSSTHTWPPQTLA